VAEPGGAEPLAREEIVGDDARAMACWFSNNRPACSNTRFLLVASTFTSTLLAGRMAARRFI